MFGNSLGNNVCLRILRETMYVLEFLGWTLYVWESLGKQCMFVNPWGNDACLGISEETMYVWESLGSNVCLGIIGERCVLGNP